MDRRSLAVSIMLPDNWSDSLAADDASRACEKCGIKFSLLQRKVKLSIGSYEMPEFTYILMIHELQHHCRFCGKIFCKKCTKTKMELPEEFGYEGLQRVCLACIPVIEGKTRGTGTMRHHRKKLIDLQLHDINLLIYFV